MNRHVPTGHLERHRPAMVVVHTGPEGSLSAGRKQGDKPGFSQEGLKGVPSQDSWLQTTGLASSMHWSLEFSEVNFGALVLTQSDLALGSQLMTRTCLVETALGRTSGSGDQEDIVG